MLHAIRLAGDAEPFVYLMPACFESGGAHHFSAQNMPAQSRKFTVAGDAAHCCESLPFACVVEPLEGTGRQYEPVEMTGLVSVVPTPDMPGADAIRAFAPLGGNSAAKVPAPAAVPAPVRPDARPCDRLEFDPHLSADSPVVRGTWVTAAHVVFLVVDGWSWADILRTYPELTEADIRACLTYTLGTGEGTVTATDGEGR